MPRSPTASYRNTASIFIDLSAEPPALNRYERDAEARSIGRPRRADAISYCPASPMGLIRYYARPARHGAAAFAMIHWRIYHRHRLMPLPVASRVSTGAPALVKKAL